MDVIEVHTCNPFDDDICQACKTRLQRDLWAFHMRSILQSLEELEELVDELQEDVGQLVRLKEVEEPDLSKPPTPEVPVRKARKRSRQNKKGDNFVNKRITVHAPNQTVPADQVLSNTTTVKSRPAGTSQVQTPFVLRSEDFPPLQ